MRDWSWWFAIIGSVQNSKFRKIMRDPRWLEQLDLAFRPSFDARG